MNATRNSILLREAVEAIWKPVIGRNSSPGGTESRFPGKAVERKGSRTFLFF